MRPIYAKILTLVLLLLIIGALAGGSRQKERFEDRYLASPGQGYEGKQVGDVLSTANGLSQEQVLEKCQEECYNNSKCTAVKTVKQGDIYTCSMYECGKRTENDSECSVDSTNICAVYEKRDQKASQNACAEPVAPPPPPPPAPQLPDGYIIKSGNNIGASWYERVYGSSLDAAKECTPNDECIGFTHDGGVSYLIKEWGTYQPEQGWQVFEKDPKPVQKVPMCNKDACNTVMYDWMVNRFWAFYPPGFGECSGCGDRGFAYVDGVLQGYKDGQWNRYGDKVATYNALKIQ